MKKLIVLKKRANLLVLYRNTSFRGFILHGEMDGLPTILLLYGMKHRRKDWEKIVTRGKAVAC